MLHHAEMSPDDRRMVGELVQVIVERSHAVVHMHDLATARTTRT
jgi:hypothetical protein